MGKRAAGSRTGSRKRERLVVIGAGMAGLKLVEELVELCPGRYDPREGSVFGSDSEGFLQRFNANLAVISCSGLTPEGPNDVNPAAAGIKRAMLARAESNMLLLDHSKYDVLALENVCSLDSIRLIVADRAPQGELARAIRRAGIAVEVAAEPAVAKAPRRAPAGR